MKDLKKKTNYFLDSGSPMFENGVIESIQDKTFKKIERGQESNNRIQYTPKKKKLSFVILSSAVAAVLLFILSIKYAYYEQDFPDKVAMTEETITELNSDEIVLILSNSKQIIFTEQDLIRFTPEGVLSNSPIPMHKTSQSRNTLNQLIVPKGMTSQLLLSDGTKIWVNAGSKVLFPSVFSKEKRDIYIDGEAYMEVAHKPEQPFYVATAYFEIKVLGTSFNVFAYKEDIMKEIALISGEIEITDKHDQRLQMRPNELVTLSQNTISGKKQVDAKYYKAWVDKVLMLNGETLSSIAHRLTLTYGIEITCEASIGKEEVFGKLDLRNSIEEILNNLELMLPLSVEKTNGTFKLRNK